MGSVRHLVRSAPQVVTLGGSDAVVEGCARDKHAVLTCDPLVTALEAVEREDSQLDVRLTQDGGEAAYRLVIEPKPSMPIGNFEEEVLLRPYLNDGSTAPGVSVLVKGEKLADVMAIPGVVNFGLPAPGDEVSQRILIRSRAGRPFVLQSVEPPDTGEIVMDESDRRPCKTEHYFTLRMTFASTGANSTNLRVVAVHPAEDGQYELEIPVVAFVGG